MNAKFEKWWGEEAGVEQTAVYLIVKESCQSSWQAAIQSLEVTPELCHTAYETLISHTGRFIDGSIECIEEDMHPVLLAVISALKEQAK